MPYLKNLDMTKCHIQQMLVETNLKCPQTKSNCEFKIRVADRKQYFTLARPSAQLRGMDEA